MVKVILGLTIFEWVFCGLLSLAITLHLDDYLEKKKLLKQELKKEMEKEK